MLYAHAMSTVETQEALVALSRNNITFTNTMQGTRG